MNLIQINRHVQNVSLNLVNESGSNLEKDTCHYLLMLSVHKINECLLCAFQQEQSSTIQSVG